MMLYLTGANTSLKKSEIAPQTDVAKSLGGYVSSTIVPNAEMNSLFDIISAYTLDKHKRETIAIALINKLSKPVSDIRLKVVVNRENIATFKVAAVLLDNSLAMECINNRYAEPMCAEFYQADFMRAAVELTIINPASAGEEITLSPFNKTITIFESGIEGTYNAFENAFCNDETYYVERVSEKTLRISRRDELVLNTPLSCSYTTTAGFSATWGGQLKNDATGEVVLIDENEQLKPGEGIGLWLQRDFKTYHYPTNEQIIRDYKEKVQHLELETAEIVINYNIDNVAKNYSNDYDPEDYS